LQPQSHKGHKGSQSFFSVHLCVLCASVVS
jgi:hypothetical protein